jgi:hypothetical protein
MRLLEQNGTILREKKFFHKNAKEKNGTCRLYQQ